MEDHKTKLFTKGSIFNFWQDFEYIYAASKVFQFFQYWCETGESGPFY